jgi:hypothetical protein
MPPAVVAPIRCQARGRATNGLEGVGVGRHAWPPPRRTEGDLSTRPCQHLRQRLPDSVVCEARCPEFPACLPPPWAGLSTDLAGFLQRWAECQATSEGLDRREDQHGP